MKSACGQRSVEGWQNMRTITLKPPCRVWSFPYRSRKGRSIHKGDVLAVLESMKMQNELRSPRDGKVIRVKVKPGERVEQKETMLSVV